MSKELLSDYKDRLIEKHGYDTGFAEDLAIMADSLEAHFGEEYRGVIRDTILSAKYVKADLKKGSQVYETTPEVLEKTFNGKLKLEESKYPGPLGVSQPTISFDGTEFHIDEVQRVVALPHYFDAKNPDSLAGLSRETMRLVSGYVGGYTIEDNTLITKRGLLEERAKLTLNEAGAIDETPISKFGSSLEEGLLRYDELEVIRESYDSSYDSPQEPASRLICGFLTDGLDLAREIREARITKDQAELRQILAERMGVDLDDFSERIDTITEFEERRRALNLDEADTNKAFREIVDKYYASDIAPILSDAQASLAQDEMSTEHRQGM